MSVENWGVTSLGEEGSSASLRGEALLLWGGCTALSETRSNSTRSSQWLV